MALTFSTARRTPLPPNRVMSPSRSSIASLSPVDAPEGTEAETSMPPSSLHQVRTVGFPLESRISIALTAAMVFFKTVSPFGRLSAPFDGTKALNTL